MPLSSQPEISHLHLTVVPQQDVLGLDVAMDDSQFGRTGQCRGDRPQHFYRPRHRKTGSPLQLLFQVAAGNIFLRDVMLPVGLSNFEDLHNVLVRQSRHRPGLVVETPHVTVVLGELRLEHLDGNLAIERILHGEVDVGHPPTAQPAEHQIFAELLAGKIARRWRWGMIGHF